MIIIRGDIKKKVFSGYIIILILILITAPSLYPAAAFRRFLDTRLQLSRAGADAGEFLVVTFSWENIGPAPKLGCRLAGNGQPEESGQVSV